MGLEPAADGENGPLQFGRDALGDMVVGSRQVVEARGSGLQIAVPPNAADEFGWLVLGVVVW